MRSRRDVTVIYYTSNREKPEFEANIRKALWATAKRLRIPLISVSQQPLDFGHNICVGDVGSSSQNAYRQIQVGAMAAKTRFVCTAEADCLYPRDYFLFQPERDDTFYIANPVWILFNQTRIITETVIKVVEIRKRMFFLKPTGSELAMYVGTETLIDRIETVLDGLGQWGSRSCDGISMPYLLAIRRRFRMRVARTERFEVNEPVVSFKTDQNMHRKTGCLLSTRRESLDPWGSAGDLIRRYQCQGILK